MNNHNLFHEIGGVYEIFPYVDVMFANIMKTGWLWIHEYMNITSLNCRLINEVGVIFVVMNTI